MLVLETPPKDDGHTLRPNITHPMARHEPWPERLLVVGYRYTERLSSDFRMEATIPRLMIDCAKARFDRFGCELFVEMILADCKSDGRVTHDSCDGDSGGPVCAQLAAARGYRRVAITLRGVPTAQPVPDLHRGGGGVYRVFGRRSVSARLDGFGTSKADPGGPRPSPELMEANMRTVALVAFTLFTTQLAAQPACEKPSDLGCRAMQLAQSSRCGSGLAACLGDTDSSYWNCEQGCRSNRDNNTYSLCKNQCYQMYSRDFCYRRHCQ